MTLMEMHGFFKLISSLTVTLACWTPVLVRTLMAPGSYSRFLPVKRSNNIACSSETLEKLNFLYNNVYVTHLHEKFAYH